MLGGEFAGDPDTEIKGAAGISDASRRRYYISFIFKAY